MDWIPWVKALHVLSVIAWMAALLYLPRLFVYHADAAPGSDKSETFKVMERRLLRGIANPSMVVVWATGIALYVASEFWTQGWMHAKWLGVIALTLLHHACARWRRDFERDENARSARFYRVWNEVPALFAILIVVLVIVKPF
ncbi:MAG: protoporphyrinogen oxidase HemJ [Rhodospirillaceae bacterium]|nr:protoporphyrinogen oxidase HemJ [Rhodospirillaceae bacterium]MDE0618617.1 protoporphyrinogen oxidase HemJ [Rhodospirillaceae bacterium]